MAKELCIYCNIRAGDTRDHVPPKSVILKPYPPNLPTVPACKECNHGFGRAMDIDFKLYLALMIAISDSSSARRFLASANRTLNNDRVRMEKIKKQIVAYSEGSDQFLVKIDKEDRIQHRLTLERVVKGLFYYRHRRHVPNDFKIEIYDWMETDIGEIFPQIEVVPNKLVINEDVFYAFHQEVPERKGASLWELHFYESYVVWAVTGPNELLMPEL